MSHKVRTHGSKVHFRGGSPRARSERRTGLALVTPTFVVVVIVVIAPVIEAIRQSFFGDVGLGQAGYYVDTPRFAGFANYQSIFSESGRRFWNAVFNTTLFAVVTVTVETVLGVIMALAMHNAKHMRGWVRAAILVPWAIPTAVSGVLWKWMFNPHGVVNNLLSTDVLWSTGNWTAKSAIIIADIWKTAPFIGLLTLAGLQIIPDEIYEAAQIDGAGIWTRFRRITLPLIRPALVVAILFRLLGALKMYDLPYVMVGARTKSVETMSMLVQDEAANLHYGSAASYAVMLFVYVFALALIFVRALGADVVGFESRHIGWAWTRVFRGSGKKSVATSNARERTGEGAASRPCLEGKQK